VDAAAVHGNPAAGQLQIERRYNCAVDEELERVLNQLEDAAQFAKGYRFALTDDYLALIDAVEAMPQNRSGSDKSGTCDDRHADTETFRHVRPAPRDR
jgi:hypothetical protein